MPPATVPPLAVMFFEDLQVGRGRGQGQGDRTTTRECQRPVRQAGEAVGEGLVDPRPAPEVAPPVPSRVTVVMGPGDVTVKPSRRSEVWPVAADTTDPASWKPNGSTALLFVVVKGESGDNALTWIPLRLVPDASTWVKVKVQLWGNATVLPCRLSAVLGKLIEPCPRLRANEQEPRGGNDREAQCTFNLWTRIEVIWRPREGPLMTPG